MDGNFPGRSACQRLVQARLASVMSQYQVSVRTRPCAIFRPERIDVADEDEEPGKVLAACRDAEFGALFDCVASVTAGIRKPDDLRFEACACSRSMRSPGY